MRPNDSSTKRKRASQMQRYLEMRRSQNKRETCKAEFRPAKTPLARATGSRVEDHDEPIFGTTSKLVATTMLAEGDQYYLNEFDKLIDAQDRESPLYLNPGGTASPSLNFAVDRAASSSTPREFAPDGPDFHADVLGPNMELDSWRYYETLQTPGRTLSETRGEKELFESEGDSNLPNIEPAPSNVHHSLGNLSKAGTPLEAVPLQLLASENQSTQIDQKALLSNSPDSPHRLAEPVNHTLDRSVSSHSSVSDLSVLANRLSKCSLGEKQFIKDTLRRFSVSTLSSMNSSHGSGGSVRLAKRPGDRIPFRPARSSNRVLPGDFITSNVNTFWDHIAIWCDQGNPWWVDRFGNTSLHIAAALDATYQELQAIFDKGASIHVCNSGGQTFMHLLNPLVMDNNSLISLTNYLRQNNFNFDHRDVQGHSFIDSLELRGLDMSNYAEFWPTSVVYSLRRELYDQGRTAKVSPPWSDTWSEAWSYSGSTSLCELLKVPKVVLARFKHFEDFYGRNCLHVAADTAQKPSQVSEQSFMDSRLSLVRDLLSIGVELDHHDNWGETPLMTHIRTLPSQDNIIFELLHSGADINSRNKEGETALHISIKLGDIIGTKALLAQRTAVNLHVRTWEGKGLLAVAFKAQYLARDDVGLYAKISICMALAIDAGAIMAPTIFDEWDLRESAREALRKARYIVATQRHR
ncbi:hypothetical protein XANCAGTX0491_005632 [Xanthoria calcicola]